MSNEEKNTPHGEGQEERLIAPELTEVERSEGEVGSGAINRSSEPGANEAPPNPEVAAIARRRTFSAEYKRRIVHEADQCTQAGDIGALLRREGLYSSILAEWRRLAKAKGLEGLGPRKRGPKPNPALAERKENERLKRKILRIERELKTAGLIIDVQKKVSEVLGIRLETIDETEESSS